MTQITRRDVLKIAAAGAAAALPAVPRATQAQTTQKRELVVAQGGDIASLDPYSFGDTFTLAVLNHVYEGLVRYDDQLKIEPALAETLAAQARTAADEQEAVGLAAVLLVPAALRLLLSRFLRRSVPSLRVLSHAEVPDSKGIRVSAVFGARS